MTDTTASINARRTKGTGLTEAHAKRAFDQLGTEYLAIISIKSESRGDDVKGKEHVNFVINDLEIVSPTAVEHVRELTRALFMNRQLHSEDGQLAIDTRSDVEPTVEGVLAAGAGHIPHAYVDTASSLCELCEEPAGAKLHHVLEDETDEPAEQPEPTDEAPDAAEETADATTPDPWAYDGPEGTTGNSNVTDPFAVSTP